MYLVSRNKGVFVHKKTPPYALYGGNLKKQQISKVESNKYR